MNSRTCERGTRLVSNAGSDSGLFPSPSSGDPDRAYTELHAALHATGKYKVLGDPEPADLVLELRLFAACGPESANKFYGFADPLPMFCLVVYEESTHYVLWTIRRAIEAAAARFSAGVQ